jgi:hypothetical protein
MMVPADRQICLAGVGSAVSPTVLCNPIRRYGTVTTINNVDYVLLGSGSYQQRKSDLSYELVSMPASVDSVLLFKGSDVNTNGNPSNGNLTIRDGYQGIGLNSTGSIVLYNGNPYTNPTGAIDMAKFDVRVSSAMVSSIGSSSNRVLESFLNMPNPFTGFLGGGANIGGSTNTTNTTNTTTVRLPTLVGTIGNQSSSGVIDLERFAVNGNTSILAISGSLTIENCPNNTFEMKGVRTVIVTGDLVIKCNIGYGANNDASWAWIAKNGNIKVYNGTGTPNVRAVTNLAGVFVAVKDSAGGGITYTGSNTTQAILRIEGSLYGDATPLFNSRLYGRATGAYDILTTGTVISYSNRALVSPPPLLSQYLGAYSVQRVVQ